MPRNISFALTTEQFRTRTKTVTRRIGWWKDKNGKRLVEVGDILNGCVKCMGLKPGEKIERLGQIRVLSVYRESLRILRDYPIHGKREAIREGFPDVTGYDFAMMFCEHMGGDITQEVTRIEFEYLDLDES